MKKSTVVIVWGIIISIASCAFSYLLYVTHNIVSSIGYLGIIILFAGLVVAMLQYRKKVNGGYASFGQLYGLAMLISLVICVIDTSYTTVLVNVSPAYIEEIKNEGDAKIINLNLPNDITQKYLEMNEQGSKPLYQVVGAIFRPIIGCALIGLLAAGITAKKKPFMEDDNNTSPA